MLNKQEKVKLCISFWKITYVCMCMCVFVHRSGTSDNFHTIAARNMKMNGHVHHETMNQRLVEP